jgi:hypothetical protein
MRRHDRRLRGLRHLMGAPQHNKGGQILSHAGEAMHARADAAEASAGLGSVSSPAGIPRTVGIEERTG